MRILFAIIAAVALSLTACVEENISYSPELKLSFSCDTLVFDTLFSGQPSATRTLMMYNRNKNALQVDEIRLGGGAASQFRFNVDGRIADPGETIKDIVIKGRDSLYILVEMTPDACLPDSLFSYALDSLMFMSNGNRSSVKLLGVGRSAHLVNNLSITGDTLLTSQRPYLVFGYIHIPEGKTLTIGAGTKIFMHSGANIIADGKLIIDGTPDNPVEIRGDRFDNINDVAQTPYSQMPNQWGGIYLQNPAESHKISNARIHGMSTGIMLVGAYRSTPSLRLSGSVIHNSGRYGIYSQMADLTVENTEISNCGESCMLVIGGSTYLAQSTIANYYRFATRKTASLRVVNAVIQNGMTQTFPIDAFVAENSIVFGQNGEELELVADSSSLFNIFFSHTLIKGVEVQAPHFSDCLWARSRNYSNAVDTVFKCTSVADIATTGYYNFRLDSLSFARNCASKAVSAKYPYDIDNYPRTADTRPDLGAYEFH